MSTATTFSSLAGHASQLAYVSLARNEPSVKVRAQLIRVRERHFPSCCSLPLLFASCCCCSPAPASSSPIPIPR